MLSVTPDTVVKWIKRGRLRAQRTLGGHYRIPRKEIENLKLTSDRSVDRRVARWRSLYCWEFNSKDGQPLGGCRECFVYRTRAQRCYEVIKLAADVGHQKLFCQGSCEACGYFDMVHRKIPNVLIVTDDQILTALLKREASAAPFILETAECEYSCSALLNSFRPDCVIIDCSLGTQRVENICRHLLQDARIPFARIILTAEPGKFPRELDQAIFERMEKPFEIKDILSILYGET